MNLELQILKALTEIPFPVGKNLLADFLIGNQKNKSIKRNGLDKLKTFATASFEKEKIMLCIEQMSRKGLIEQFNGNYNRYSKLLRVTEKGKAEVLGEGGRKNIEVKTKITEEDLKIFDRVGSLLEGLNNEQKKAVTSPSKKILCIAGAGSGKTKVLVKRIEFLVNHRSVSPEKILAITFTRKASEEMSQRLRGIGIKTNVFTFNSFCERTLRKYSGKIYAMPTRVQSYTDKILAVNMAFASSGISPEEFFIDYFGNSKRNFDELFRSFVSDCFLIIEYLKTNKLQSDFILKNQKPENGKMFSQLKKIIDFVMEHSRINGLRDYSDQLNEVINLFRNDKNTIPKFEHVLVDEFQDVNSIQMELIRLLEPENLFFVGDPRQSIFGWRGSRIDYILSFEKENKDAEILYLTKNYRSSKKIVEFMNAISSEFSLPNLSSTRNDTGEVRILEFENPESEIAFIVESIRNDYEKFLDTFILARTNRQIEEISKSLSIRGIQHKIKTDEGTRGSGKLTLATIHAIKGLEADAVFIVGADDKNLPCRVPESPITEIIREEYDRFSEEKRLFYVAVSRAKKRLTLTFSGKPSYFITDELMSIANRQA